MLCNLSFDEAPLFQRLSLTTSHFSFTPREVFSTLLDKRLRFVILLERLDFRVAVSSLLDRGRLCGFTVEKDARETVASSLLALTRVGSTDVDRSVRSLVQVWKDLALCEDLEVWSTKLRECCLMLSIDDNVALLECSRWMERSRRISWTSCS